MNPALKLDVAAGGEWLVPFAKRMHARLSAQTRFGSRRFDFTTGETLTVTWGFVNKVRITAGLIAGTAEYTSDGILYYNIPVTAAGLVVMPPALEKTYTRRQWWYNNAEYASLANGLYRVGVLFLTTPFADALAAGGGGTYIAGVFLNEVVSADRAVLLGDEALLAAKTDPYNEVYVIFEDYTSDPAGVTESHALLFPSDVRAVIATPGVSAWKYSTTPNPETGGGAPNDWVMTTAFGFVPANYPGYADLVTWDRQVSSTSASSVSGNYMLTAAVLVYSDVVTPGATYTDDLFASSSYIDYQEYAVHQITRVLVERIDLRTGSRSLVVNETLAKTFYTVLRAKDTDGQSFQVGYHFRGVGAVTNPPADRAYEGDGVLIERNAAYNPTLLVNDNGDWVLTRVDTSSPAVDSRSTTGLFSWQVSHPFSTDYIPYVFTTQQDRTLSITRNGVVVWSQTLTGIPASFPTSTTRQVEQHGADPYFMLTSPAMYSTRGRFSAVFIGAEADATPIRKGLWFDGTTVHEVSLTDDADRLILYTSTDESTFVLTVPGKWAKFYADDGTLIETLTLASDEAVEGASTASAGVYYTSVTTAGHRTGQKKHSLSTATGAWVRTEKAITVQASTTVPPAPNPLTDSGVPAGSYTTTLTDISFYSLLSPQERLILGLSAPATT